MRLLYFAWLRTKLGKSSEELVPPPDVGTVGALLDWLETRGPDYRAALADRRIVRVAVNQEYVGSAHPVAPGDEIALFPPVTGG
jgi:molybdopterin synthase sulfur carrier subunit